MGNFGVINTGLFCPLLPLKPLVEACAGLCSELPSLRPALSSALWFAQRKKSGAAKESVKEGQSFKINVYGKRDGDPTSSVVTGM